MKNFFARLFTGIAYVGIICFCIVWHPLSFCALFALVTAFCLREYCGLLNAKRGAAIGLWLNILGGVLLFASAFLYFSGYVPDARIFFVYLFYLVAIFVGETLGKRHEPFLRLSRVIFGQIYIALPVAMLCPLYFSNGETHNWLIVLSLFIFIWVNDTGAYVVGSTLGKHRLCERISPKKSWEGFFGGLVFTVASSFIFAGLEPQIAWYHWAALSLFIVVFGTFGDLLESLFKRTLEVKDSGNALPGHGGFLDRFDSLLLAVYAALFYYYLLIY
ncbi:MAG: phosphatidate cytidylyltransferase [Dysgonamonadaceae bacterium]|jgi:phosphatidate cytidylyltransferase|nr:phosphatidate cytidylyltransferase [Dysgonamonadaceae bacterium]